MAQKKSNTDHHGRLGIGKSCFRRRDSKRQCSFIKSLYQQISEYNFDNLWRSSRPARWTDGQFGSRTSESWCRPNCIPGIATNQCGGEGWFFCHRMKYYLQSIRYAKENNKPLHLLGLVSDGGVHSHINHLKAIIDRL